MFTSFRLSRHGMDKEAFDVTNRSVDVWHFDGTMGQNI